MFEFLPTKYGVCMVMVKQIRNILWLCLLNAILQRYNSLHAIKVQTLVFNFILRHRPRQPKRYNIPSLHRLPVALFNCTNEKNVGYIYIYIYIYIYYIFSGPCTVIYLLNKDQEDDFSFLIYSNNLPSTYIEYSNYPLPAGSYCMCSIWYL